MTEHPLHNAQVSRVSPELGRDRVPGSVHVHPALDVCRDEHGPLQVLVPPRADWSAPGET